MQHKGLRPFYIFLIAGLALAATSGKAVRNSRPISSIREPIVLLLDSPPGDLRYPIRDYRDPRSSNTQLDLNDPSNVKSDIVYDPATGKYTVYKKIGDQYFRYPMSFTLDEYLKYDMEKSIRDYWRSKIAADDIGNKTEGKEETTKPFLGFAVESPSFDRVFGGNLIDIRPQGSAEVTLGITSSRSDNPTLAEKQRRFTNFDFKQRIQMNVLGSVGEKLKISTSYNTEATFDFENQFKLEYTGLEDEIIKKIEFGNVSLPLSSSLISGSQTLFGAKTQLQFGKLTSTTVFSSQKGKKSEIEVAGGAQTSYFELKADEYEANKHYFLSLYFRNQYDRAMQSLPIPSSGINITRIEVWVTNTNNTTENTRNIIALSDLGEDPGLYTEIPLTDLSPTQVPDNDHNSLYGDLSPRPEIYGFSGATGYLSASGFEAARHYEKLESARKLDTTAYTVNARLGFISLNQQPLNNDEILAVAYEYTLNGQVYQVGQFSTDGVEAPKALLVKLLKPTITNPQLKLWDLMMKNVYSINAFQVNRDQFVLNVFYNNPNSGVDINYLPLNGLDKIPLIQVLNSDRLDPVNQPNPDGIFDFVDDANTKGGTINSRNGRIFFPVVEPFGEHLKSQLIANGIVDTPTIESIVFQQLYDSTKIAALQFPKLNRFKLKGSYRSASGSEIPLNALNIPKGSVSVTSGGNKLIEGVDYTVDYNLGRVKILDQGILESQMPLKISLESNTMFSVQQKTFLGQRFDYRVNKDFNLGATLINLSERPITPKVNFNEEPINNTMMGIDGSYSTEAPWLTRAIDRLPFLETKEASSISINGEYARLMPGHSKAIGNEGNSYIDDFEGSQSTIDLRAVNAWTLASTPQGQPDIFPEGNLTNDLSYGYNRAQLAWYIIDNSVFFQKNSLRPGNINNNILSDHRQRQVIEQEVFPERQIRPGTLNNISVFDMAYYPSERGPYNFNPNLDGDGRLKVPKDSWAGIMRRITTTDFEANNVEFIQFWLMDPFNTDSENKTGGKLYINLGNISEDVLKDSRKSFENGLPKDPTDIMNGVDTTTWGVVPRKQSVVNAFASVDGSTKFQDIGFDGLNKEGENAFFQAYINSISNVVSPAVLNAVKEDPANDNYHYYRGGDYDAQGLDILGRYKRYNGVEGNSPTDKDSPESYSTSATNMPNTEDVNLDNNLSETESYFQYEISLHPDSMVVGKNYITSMIEAVPDYLPNGQNKPVRWYQFKVPVRMPQRTIGSIQDFRSVRFIRMFMREFNEPVVLRFGRLEFIRGEWRKYYRDLANTPADDPSTSFDVGAVNLEENGKKQPIGYTLPPEIQREIDYSTTNLVQINEQSLSLKTCDLPDGDARAAFRNVNLDVRSYKTMKLFVHAEPLGANDPLNYADLTAFIRLGTDFDDNYYEYEIPLTPSDLNSGGDPYRVWPADNNMEIKFEDLTSVKIQRNNTNQSVAVPYWRMVGKARVTVKGNPALNDIRTIMLGIRNPNMNDNPWTTDLGNDRNCVEVWINEMRLADFDEFGGWAAVGRMNVKLADFGNLAVAGNISTPGFGSIEKKLSERQRETKKGFDASTNLELGKFLPEKSGIKVPMFLSFSEQMVNPMFDPLNPDVEFEKISRNLTAKERRDRLRESQTYTKRRSMNFTNVRKERTQPGAKEHFYDIENLSFTYSYSENYFRDINTQYRANKLYRGGLTYTFTNKPKVITPFRNIELFSKSKYFDPIKDFNFYIGLTKLAFRTNIDRSYTESQIRNNIESALDPIPTYTKTFNWQRSYDLAYDLTRSVKIDFSANNMAYIGEPRGRVSKDEREAYEAFKDTVWQNIRRLGETTKYNHNTNLTYKFPLKKFPLTDWLDGSLTYSSSYDWERAPFSQDTLGHTIQNSSTRQVSLNANMITLYSKVPLLKRIVDKRNKSGGGQIRAVKSKDLQDKDKGKVKGKAPAQDSTQTQKVKTGDLSFGERMLSVLLMTKTISVTSSQSQGTLLPGYGRKTSIMGMDNRFEGPGVGFIFGRQEDDYFDEAARKGWLVEEPDIFTPATRTSSRSRDIRASLEPAKSLRIDLSMTQNLTESSNEFFRYDTALHSHQHQNPMSRGTYSVSIISISSAFKNDDPKNFSNEVFTEMLENRILMSQRLAAENNITKVVDTTGYYDGYSGISQDVVIPAFIAAYTGKDPNKQKLNPFEQTAMPNWRVTYDGLSKLPAFQKLFKSFTLSHSYRSTFNTSYQSNLQAVRDGQRQRTGLYQDFVPERQVASVAISEAFSPLLKVDATLKNSLIAKVELKKDRQVSLSLSNLQVTEVKGTEWAVGTGYRFKDVKLPIKISNKELKSDMNVSLDVSVRRNVTVIRKASELITDPTSGRRVVSIKFAADYTVSSKVSLRAYYDRVVTKPILSTPYPTYNTNAGLSLRFSLSQ